MNIAFCIVLNLIFEMNCFESIRFGAIIKENGGQRIDRH